MVRFRLKNRSKMTKKNKKISQKNVADADSFLNALEKATDALFYISETDAEIVPFIGREVDAVTAEAIVELAGADDDATVEVISADAFFERLTTHKDWFGDREKKRAERFAKVHEILKAELTEMAVVRIGRVRIDIIVAGRDRDGRLAGIRTWAVET